MGRWNTDFQLTFHLIDCPIFRCSSQFLQPFPKLAILTLIIVFRRVLKPSSSFRVLVSERSYISNILLTFNYCIWQLDVEISVRVFEHKNMVNSKMVLYLKKHLKFMIKLMMFSVTRVYIKILLNMVVPNKIFKTRAI